MASTLLYFADESRLAQAIAQSAGLPAHPIALHRFPDGEIKLTLPQRLPPQLVLLRGLQDPNEKLIALLLAAGAARELGAQRIILVAPYLAYMRQDMAFSPGEAVSQRLVGRFLAEQVDAVITVDPHLHRIRQLSEAIDCEPALALSAAPLLGRWIGEQQPDALLLGPDAESQAWVESAAKAAGLTWAVCEKVRYGDRSVQVALPRSIDWTGRQVVLIDDVCSTGHTLAQTAQRLFEAGAQGVDVAITHPLFTPGAFELLKQSGIDRIWSADTIAHASNAVSVAPLLAKELLALLSGP